MTAMGASATITFFLSLIGQINMNSSQAANLEEMGKSLGLGGYDGLILMSTWYWPSTVLPSSTVRYS